MKSTGVVRRIDDLGRIVIPKEIRKTMHILEGDQLEILTGDGGEVIFRRFSALETIASDAEEMAKELSKAIGAPVAVTDRDKVIVAVGHGKKELIMKPVSEGLKQMMSERSSYRATAEKEFFICDGAQSPLAAAVTVISDGEYLGAVAAFEMEDGKPLGDAEYRLVCLAAAFLKIRA